MAEKNSKNTGSKSASTNNPVSTRTRTKVSSQTDHGARITEVSDNIKSMAKLTPNEIAARQVKKYATTSTTGFNNRTAYGTGDTSGSAGGNFYSPQLSTDFLEKPQNLRERRAWYRHFYNSNEFVGQAVDLHSQLPLSKIRLEKPKSENSDLVDYVYDFFVEMCDDVKLFKSLLEISHEYWLLGNAFVFAEDHSPYEGIEEGKANELKEAAKIQSQKLFEEFQITDKDPNYKGWRKLLVLPPDQVRIRKIPLSDDSMIEYIPDPETRKSILAASTGQYSDYLSTLNGVANPEVPDKLIDQIRENGSIPLDNDPYSGSHVYHLARKKSQYETLGVSILERCVNTLLLFDKLRQAQTQIASRHMTPIRIVWAEELSEGDVDDLREQVDLALMDPDFSIIANYEVHWEEMGSNGRLLELSTEYEHIENSLFAGLGVTREMLTGEGTYAGNRVTLEILNTQYLLFRELLQEYVENNLFKPIAKKKGFVEKDKYGREKLIYPKLSFTRLAIRDNDAFFDQAFQLYNKGSVSIDIILDMLNIDPEATRKKIEADLFTVNDFAFNQLVSNMYSAVAQPFVDSFDLQQKLADYMGLPPLPKPEGEEGGEEGGGLGDLGGGARFASSKKANKSQEYLQKRIASMGESQKKALDTLIRKATESPEKLNAIAGWLNKPGPGLDG
jgi:hypothetical protein